MALWKKQLDYSHGTGHGVGSYLCVHEGPQGISRVAREGTLLQLQAGMTASNEPGYYKEGSFGIRIENILVTRHADEPANKWLEFETLTLVPLDKKLIDVSMLTQYEIKWINDYHFEVYDVVKGFLKGEAAAWLKEACKRLVQ